MAHVEIIKLRKTYGGTVAVDAVDLTIRTGEFVTLLGPSGCGKTTTLRCLAGFMPPDGGDIRIDGQSVTATPPAGRDFGVVFQNYALFPHLSVYDNVGYGLRTRRVPQAEERRRVEEALAMVRLEGLGSRLPRELSGGQQQRVALARAIVIRPRLLLLDEPLANLDAKLRQDVRWLIRQVQKAEGMTALYVTHDQAEAMAMSDRVAVMKHGRVAQVGTPREIYQTPKEPYVAAFTGEMNCLPVQVTERLAEDRYLVSGPAGSAVVRGPAGLAPGVERTLMVRPEGLSLRLDPPDGDGWRGLTGRVTACVFVGAAQQCEVAPAGSDRLRLFAPPNVSVPVGAETYLLVDPDAAWLMPAEPHS